MSDDTFTNLVALAGGTSNLFYAVPTLLSQADSSAPITTHDNLGYVIGYNYLANAGVQTIPQRGQQIFWVSPKKITDLPSSELLADPNFWVKSSSSDPAFQPGFGTIAPHGANGACNCVSPCPSNSYTGSQPTSGQRGNRSRRGEHWLSGLLREMAEYQTNADLGGFFHAG